MKEINNIAYDVVSDVLQQGMTNFSRTSAGDRSPKPIAPKPIVKVGGRCMSISV